MGNLAAPVEEWTVGGTALTSLMDVERRHGMLGVAFHHIDGTFFVSPFTVFTYLSRNLILIQNVVNIRLLENKLQFFFLTV